MRPPPASEGDGSGSRSRGGGFQADDDDGKGSARPPLTLRPPPRSVSRLLEPGMYHSSGDGTK